MKRLCVFLLCAAMTISVWGCGNSGADTKTTTPDNSEDDVGGADYVEKAAESSTGEVINLSLGTGTKDDHFLTLFCDEVSKEMEEKTNGQVKIAVYPQDQLGAPGERASMTVAGELDMSMTALSVFDGYCPRMGVVSSFFMFENWQHYFNFMESDIYAELIGELETNINATVMTELPSAKRHIVSKKPIESLGDMKGLKIRVPNEEMPIAFVKALGAAATPIEYSELYTALQNGTVEAMENGAAQIVSTSMFEVTSDLTYTSHQFQTQGLVISNAAKEKLSSEQYETLCSIVDELSMKYRELGLEQEEKDEEYLRTVLNFHEIDLAEFYDACNKVYDSYDDVWGDGTWEAIKATK